MKTYSCSIVDADDHVIAAKVFEARDDLIAIDEARRIFASAIGSGYEVWDCDRLAYRELVSLEMWRRDRAPA